MMKTPILIAVAIPLLAACAATPRAPLIPAHGVIGVTEAHLDPEFWIRHAASTRRVVLDEAAIDAQNAKLKQLDRSVHDVESLPRTLTANDVRAWVEKMSERPDDTLYDEHGRAVEASAIDALVANVNAAAIPATQQTRFGMIVRRSDLRTFPTRLRLFNEPDDGTDIDRFQENALFPGTPVAIVHESRDGDWWFVVSPLYAAWIAKGDVAQGTAD